MKKEAEKKEPEKKVKESEKEKEPKKIPPQTAKKMQEKPQKIAPKKIIRSKRFTHLRALIQKDKLYTVEEAIELAKKTANTKFDGALEAHFRLGINPKKGEEQVRGAVALPHGTGKSKKIAAFVADGREDEAKLAGADIAGSAELIQNIKQTGKIDFEVAVATPDMMPKLAVIAKILGPRGLMPSPKSETITTNLKKTIGELKKGKVNFKNDDTGNVHAVIGKASFETKKLVENFQALFGALKKSKPSSSKGVFMRSITLHATMGPGIKVTPS